MNKTELIKQIESTIGKTKVVALSKILKEQQFALRDLIDLTFYADKNIAFRASWLLENVFLNDPEFYQNDLEYLIKRVKEVKHTSCQRQYAKIIMHLTAKKAPKAIQLRLQEIDMELVIEQLFDWLINPKVKIAVKAFASEALFNMRHRYTWITEELTNQLQYMMREGSSAIQSRGKRLLSRIK